MVMDRKKALITATVGGFLPRFELGNARILQQLGYEVHYASNFNIRIYEYDMEFIKQQGICCHQIDFARSPRHMIQNGRAYRQLKHLLGENEYSLIHCHTPVAGVLTRLAARRRRKGPDRVKVLYTAHGFHFYQGGPLSGWLLYYPVECRMSLYTDVLLTINREDYLRAKKFCEQQQPWTGQQCLVYQTLGAGLEPDRFAVPDRKEAAAKRKEFGFSPENFLLVSVGELNRNKNHEVVIRALAGLEDPNLRYLICGKGSEQGRLEALIRELKLEGRVVLAGFREDITQILCSADCFIFPSIREGLPMSVLEAMAAGLPIITSDNRGTREYIVDDSNGIVCRNTPEAYQAAIRRLVQSPALRRRMGKKARKTAQQYDAAHARDVMREIYQCL